MNKKICGFALYNDIEKRSMTLNGKCYSTSDENDHFKSHKLGNTAQVVCWQISNISIDQSIETEMEQQLKSDIADGRVTFRTS